MAASLPTRPEDLTRIAPPPYFPDGVVAYRIANGVNIMPAWKNVMTHQRHLGSHQLHPIPAWLAAIATLAQAAQSYTEGEYREWLRAAGFGQVERKLVANNMSLITARELQAFFRRGAASKRRERETEDELDTFDNCYTGIQVEVTAFQFSD